MNMHGTLYYCIRRVRIHDVEQTRTTSSTPVPRIAPAGPDDDCIEMPRHEVPRSRLQVVGLRASTTGLVESFAFSEACEEMMAAVAGSDLEKESDFAIRPL